MNKKYIGVLIISFLLNPKFGISQNVTSKKIDNLYQVKDQQPGFSIAVFKGDKIVLEKQYGTANLDYNIPINNETVFDIGSIAKQFTAAAILLLENDGKLSIKEPAYKYIDNLPRYDKGDPTIEHLLNQTSGIKEVDPYFYLTNLSFNDLLTQSRVTNIILNIDELNFKPGEYFEYTNANYVLLANIIEKVSGESFSEFLQNRIFSPLKMESTIKKSTTRAIVKNRAIGYIEEDGEYYKTHLHSTIYNGDGQVLTTPRDMFRWHRGLKHALIGTPEVWKKMHTKAKLNDGAKINYGLGVEFETHNDYQAMGFDGEIIGGFVSKYLYFPDLDIAFFTAQNTFDNRFEEKFFQLVDLYVPQKKIMRKKRADEKIVKLTNAQLEKYEGNYLFLGNEYENIRFNTVQEKEGKLILLVSDGDKIGELEPIGNHKFLMKNISFEFDGNKQFKAYANDNEKPWLFKKYEPHQYSEIDLKEFEGIYWNKSLQLVYEINLEHGKLTLRYGNGASKSEIQPLSKDNFSIPNYPIQFIRNGEGQVIKMKIMGLKFDKL
tara:strand:- start:41521 stop:43161 length:1641 start_codon:yes stop_codon:yes gene_type:complete